MYNRQMCGGGRQIAAASLDDELKNIPVTFIKMDIEGSELEAIRGARHIISTLSPKLAISLYHKLDDFEKIPALIIDINPNYTFYIRHHSLSDCDTVLYAVPRRKRDEIYENDFRQGASRKI